MNFGIIQEKDQKFVKKSWGSETWLYNGDYCAKILTVEKGKKSSFHYHKLKTETFMISEGKILLRYSFLSDISKAEEVILKKGQVFHIPIGLKHQFEGLKDSIIIEFSTHHEDSDSYRIFEGA